MLLRKEVADSLALLLRLRSGQAHPLVGRHSGFAGQLLLFVLCASLPLTAVAAKTRPAPALDSGYVAALATVDRYLQAWQTGDVETGMALLTSHAKEKVTTDVLEQIFSNPGALAYEIGRGKLLRRGRYEFPVVLVGPATGDKHARRYFSSIVVLNTGNNDWTIDKLP